MSRGFTLAELLVGLLFSMMVVAGLYTFFRDQLYAVLAQELKTATLEDARGALELMVREVRQAGAWGAGYRPPGCVRLLELSPTAIRIQADLDGNGDCNSATGEDVRYALAGPTPTCPGTTIRRNGDCLVANVSIPAGNRFLTYYGPGGAALAGSSADAAAVRRVKIVFAVQLDSPRPGTNAKISTPLASSVELRN
jgi:type II secretory pathway component PulJ